MYYKLHTAAHCLTDCPVTLSTNVQQKQ